MQKWSARLHAEGGDSIILFIVMNIPILAELEKAETVLIAGAGGGYDIFSGLPLYFWLRRAGKRVHLANLSFTDFHETNAESPSLSGSLIRVLPENSGPKYFPECYLAKWLSTHFKEDVPVYAIARTGVKPVVAAYEWLASTLRPDTLVLVDGGTDILMRGDESGLGTPQEDIASLYAGHSVSGIERKFVLCVGFGVDAFHGVCHAHFLENVSALIQQNGFLGMWSLVKEMEEFQLYAECYRFAAKKMSHHPSIVNSSILDAIEGHFGNHHGTKRTADSELFINPLMSLYWAFQLEAVVKQNLYIDLIAETTTYQELSAVIEQYRKANLKGRYWTGIPC